MSLAVPIDVNADPLYSSVGIVELLLTNLTAKWVVPDGTVIDCVFINASVPFHAVSNAGVDNVVLVAIMQFLLVSYLVFCRIFLLNANTLIFLPSEHRLPTHDPIHGRQSQLLRLTV